MPYQVIKTSALIVLALLSGDAFSACADVSRQKLINALTPIVPGDTYLAPEGGDKTPNGGFDLPVWVVMVDENGTVCHVINSSNMNKASGNANGSTITNKSWLGGRIVAAQKAFTATAFSVNDYAISTANLFGSTQNNQSLFGLQNSLPIDAFPAYKNTPSRYGTSKDPIIGQRIGGLIAVGGGLALYVDDNGNAPEGIRKIGAIGVSGDTSCTDHVIAWKIRDSLAGLNKFNNVPRGPATEGDMFDKSGNPLNLGGQKGDELYMDDSRIGTAEANGWEHPACPNTPDHTRNGGALVGIGPTGIVLTPPPSPPNSN